MQIASFILVTDRVLRQFEEQLEAALTHVQSPAAAFTQLIPLRLHELGHEHPISIPLGSLHPLDQVAGRQHERLLTAFEDPTHPSRLGKMAETANVPMFYVSPGRVRDFVRELEEMRLAQAIRPEDVEALLGKRIGRDELPQVVNLLEQFQHDLYQVYRDASDQGKGVVVLVVSQPDVLTSEEEFPRAA